jgi:predicted house-cleaning noncanonical NTP pyrophosphatase (MazG superfamily)
VLTVYNKLVRDRIPELIQADGCELTQEVLDDAGFRRELLAKLVEEAREAQDASEQELVAELADVLEVLQTLLVVTGTSWEQLEGARAAKHADRGGFSRRIFLVSTERTE